MIEHEEEYSNILESVANWVSTVFTGSSGHTESRVSEIASASYSNAFPYSFTYDGQPSSDLLCKWKYTVKSTQLENSNTKYEIRHFDPDAALEITSEITVYKKFPAVEWIMHFKNTGSSTSPVIESIYPLDLKLSPNEDSGIKLHYVMSSNNTSADFTPYDIDITHEKSITLEHCNSIPYFSTEWHGGGMVGAVGWTGPWKMQLSRDLKNGLRFQGGQLKTHFELYAGETIRTPSILIVNWQGTDRMRGHNYLRRILFEHYVPKHNGKIPHIPISFTSAFTSLSKEDSNGPVAEYVVASLNGVNEKNQLDLLNSLPQIGIEAFWIDAGWYIGGYFHQLGGGGAGNWIPKPESFPNGLRPISDAIKEKGMKFILWFCTELVERNTMIHKEHPEWVTDFTFHYGNPEARKWMTDYISDCITKWNVDIYREDGGMLQMPFFQENEVNGNNTSGISSVIKDKYNPNRQGIVEIRYIEGIYDMWDELLSRHPHLLIDNCNWRGRTCDIEMVKRSIGSLTRSEHAFWGNTPNLEQMGLAALNQYIPLSGSHIVRFDPYHVRSAATTGVCFGLPDPRGSTFPTDEAKQAFDEIRELRPFWSGDFYPLVEKINADESSWCAWQFHREDLNSGYAVIFRRSRCLNESMMIYMHDINSNLKYEVLFKETYEIKKQCIMHGSELSNIKIEISDSPGSFLIRYAAVDC